MLGDNLFHLALPKWAQILHKCAPPRQMVLAPCTSKLARKFQKLNEKNSNLGFHLWSIYQNAFYKQERDIVRRCYTTMWPQNTICNFQKVHALITNFNWSTVYSLTTKYSKNHKKFKTYQNLLKPSPMESLCQIMSMKNNKLEETIILRQLTK